MFVFRELLVHLVATRRVVFAVEQATVGVTAQHSTAGGQWWEETVRLHIPKPILLSTFAWALGQLPPLWLQSFLPGGRQFYPLPGAGPKGCFHRLATAFGTMNRLAPWQRTQGLCQCAMEGGRGPWIHRPCGSMWSKMAQVMFLLILSWKSNWNPRGIWECPSIPCPEIYWF